MHVVNTVSPVGPEVPDQKVSLLFRVPLEGWSLVLACGYVGGRGGGRVGFGGAGGFVVVWGCVLILPEQG